MRTLYFCPVVCSFFLLLFFFQAEDGIRDFCLSRGLGDVYKRQEMPQTTEPILAANGPKFAILWGHVEEMLPVSYTHLTLPTILRV